MHQRSDALHTPYLGFIPREPPRKETARSQPVPSRNLRQRHLSGSSSSLRSTEPRQGPRWMLPLLLLATLVFVGIWVDYGVFRELDRYAYHHLQPLRRTNWRLLTAPAEVPFAALLLLVAVIQLRQRGKRREAAIWVLAFLGSLVIELIGKTTVTRPYVTEGRLLGTSIVQGTFPSGHTMRTIVVAAALSAAWPRYKTWFVGWAALTVGAVELSGMHSPSEMIGGTLGGLGLVAAAHAALPRAVPAHH